MTLLTLEGTELHRVPISESELHDASPSCWCDPVEVINDNRPTLWLHRRQNQL